MTGQAKFLSLQQNYIQGEAYFKIISRLINKPLHCISLRILFRRQIVKIEMRTTSSKDSVTVVISGYLEDLKVEDRSSWGEKSIYCMQSLEVENDLMTHNQYSKNQFQVVVGFFLFYLLGLMKCQKRELKGTSIYSFIHWYLCRNTLVVTRRQSLANPCESLIILFFISEAFR